MDQQLAVLQGLIQETYLALERAETAEAAAALERQYQDLRVRFQAHVGSNWSAKDDSDAGRYPFKYHPTTRMHVVQGGGCGL